MSTDDEVQRELESMDRRRLESIDQYLASLMARMSTDVDVRYELESTDEYLASLIVRYGTAPEGLEREQEGHYIAALLRRRASEQGLVLERQALIALLQLFDGRLKPAPHRSIEPHTLRRDERIMRDFQKARGDEMSRAERGELIKQLAKAHSTVPRNVYRALKRFREFYGAESLHEEFRSRTLSEFRR